MITQKNHPANHPSKNPLGNLGLKGPNLENQIFYQKLGPVTLLVLPFPIIMPKIRTILGAVFEKIKSSYLLLIIYLLTLWAYSSTIVENCSVPHMALGSTSEIILRTFELLFYSSFSSFHIQ